MSNSFRLIQYIDRFLLWLLLCVSKTWKTLLQYLPLRRWCWTVIYFLISEGQLSSAYQHCTPKSEGSREQQDTFELEGTFRHSWDEPHGSILSGLHAQQSKQYQSQLPFFGASTAARQVDCSAASLSAQSSDREALQPSKGSAIELPVSPLGLKSASNQCFYSLTAEKRLSCRFPACCW